MMRYYRFPADIDRIQRVAWAHGWEMSRPEVETFWQAHCDKLDSSWLTPPEDEAIWAILRRIFEVFPWWPRVDSCGQPVDPVDTR